MSGASSAALTRGDAGSRTESTPSSGSRPRAGGPRRALAHAPLRPVVARAWCWEGIRCCSRGRRPARRRWALARAPRWRAGTSPARSRWATAATRRRCVRGRAMDAAPFSRVRPGGTRRFHLENPFGGWRRLPRGLGPRAAPPRGHPHPPPREPSRIPPPLHPLRAADPPRPVPRLRRRRPFRSSRRLATLAARGSPRKPPRRSASPSAPSPSPGPSPRAHTPRATRSPSSPPSARRLERSTPPRTPTSPGAWTISAPPPRASADRSSASAAAAAATALLTTTTTTRRA